MSKRIMTCLVVLALTAAPLAAAAPAERGPTIDPAGHLARLWAGIAGIFGLDAGAGTPAERPTQVSAAVEGDEDGGPYIDPDGLWSGGGDGDEGPHIDPDG